jgi:hypothetical protein
LFPVAKWILEGVVTPSAGLGGIVWVVNVYLFVEEQRVVVGVRAEQREVKKGKFW